MTSENDKPKSETAELHEKIAALDAELTEDFKSQFSVSPFLSRKIVSFQGNKDKPAYNYFQRTRVFGKTTQSKLLVESDDGRYKRIHSYELRSNFKKHFYIVKFRINWALSNSLNTYNRHSDWHKLEVCATNVSIHF